MNCKTAFVKTKIRFSNLKKDLKRFDGILSNKGDKKFIFMKSVMKNE